MSISNRNDSRCKQPVHSPLKFCAAIKAATDDLHRATERSLAKILFSPHLVPQDYLQVLNAMVQCYEPMEASFMQFPLTAALFEHRQKLNWLKEDIHYLGNYCNETPPSPAPIKLHVDTAPQALGMMYVLEGATLGGNHIQRALSQHRWLTTQQGLRFFYAYGEDRMQKWTEFLANLQQYADQHPVATPAVIDGARRAFKLIHQSILDIHQ